MSFTIYQASTPVFQHSMISLEALLAKAAAHAATKGLTADALLQARLAPDMFPLVRQIQIVSDTAKGAAARLAGLDVPSYADTETSFPQLQERLARTRAFLASIDPALYASAAERDVTLKLRTGDLHFKGADYLLKFALPNFFFHLTTAYDILRNQGLEIGKSDYLGTL